MFPLLFFCTILFIQSVYGARITLISSNSLGDNIQIIGMGQSSKKLEFYNERSSSYVSVSLLDDNIKVEIRGGAKCHIYGRNEEHFEFNSDYQGTGDFVKEDFYVVAKLPSDVGLFSDNSWPIIYHDIFGWINEISSVTNISHYYAVFHFSRIASGYESASFTSTESRSRFHPYKPPCKKTRIPNVSSFKINKSEVSLTSLPTHLSSSAQPLTFNPSFATVAGESVQNSNRTPLHPARSKPKKSRKLIPPLHEDCLGEFQWTYQPTSASRQLISVQNNADMPSISPSRDDQSEKEIIIISDDEEVSENIERIKISNLLNK